MYGGVTNAIKAIRANNNQIIMFKGLLKILFILKPIILKELAKDEPINPKCDAFLIFTLRLPLE